MDPSQRIYRSTLRGLHKCPNCDHYNGIRAKGCRNTLCPLSKLAAKNKTVNNFQKKCKIDPIQLISYTDTRMYSVRIKERDSELRDFIQITDTTLSCDSEGSIVSRNAICYVDTCKHDSTEISIGCKHVKSASDCLKFAEEIQIRHEVLQQRMNISEEMKIHIWNTYVQNQHIIPVLQRINNTMFAVKCAQSATFPAGRLHVTVSSDDEKEFKYKCVCKNTKILQTSDNIPSLGEICDHVLILIAGILSSMDLEVKYQNFLNASSHWIKDVNNYYELQLEGIQQEQQQTLMNSSDLPDNFLLMNEDFENFSENILNSASEFDSNGINFENELNNLSPSGTVGTTALYESHPPLENGNKPENNFLNLVNTVNENSHEVEECLELTDCQIELMDEFKLTNKIDLINEEIRFSEIDFFNNATNLSMDYSTVGNGEGNSNEELETNLLKIKPTSIEPPESRQSKEIKTTLPSIMSKNLSLGIERNKKKLHVKRLENGKNCFIRHGNEDRSINKNRAKNEQSAIIIQANKALNVPVLEFNEWLLFAIEEINLSLNFGAPFRELITHKFHVKKNFFSYLTSRFSVGDKRRIPNSTVIVKDGKNKGEMKLLWIFKVSSTLRRIFTCEEISIDMEKKFIKKSSGDFTLFDVKNNNSENSLKNFTSSSSNVKHKKILPTLYTVFIDLNKKISENDKGFLLEWVPNTHPKSQFGTLVIKFNLGYKKNGQILENLTTPS